MKRLLKMGICSVFMLSVSSVGLSLSCEEELSVLSKTAVEVESLDEGSPGYDRNCGLLTEKLQSNSACDLAASLSQDEIESIKNAISDCALVLTAQEPAPSP